MRVFCKGASDQLSSKQVKQDDLTSKDARKSTDLLLADEFAAEGLRVLAFGYRTAIDLQDIENSPVKTIESDLTILGITAVEDLLQDDVKECIQ